VLILAGAAAAAIAGTPVAANSRTHVMNVQLPDGAVAHVEYVGNVAPKVTVEPQPLPAFGGNWAPMATPMALPSFAGFDRMIQQMNRQMQEMARRPLGTPGMNVAAYSNSPAGATSTSVVSYSNGGTTCTRTTEIVSQGPGKPPKVTSSASGDCASAAPGGKSAAPINRT
jgi:hypothetical protein